MAVERDSLRLPFKGQYPGFKAPFIRYIVMLQKQAVRQVRLREVRQDLEPKILMKKEKGIWHHWQVQSCRGNCEVCLPSQISLSGTLWEKGCDSSQESALLILTGPVA